ncbi:MAG: rhodanese-related sulfurtransferase [Hyphomicrobiaceae bacterium]|nr:rhodanese-related sulfurtransferase [Hyphomicrobiaceae bacterium]
MSWTVSAFYKFASLDNLPERRERLVERGNALGIVGTILLAQEGINSTIAGSHNAMAAMLAEIRSEPALANLVVKSSTAEHQPFAHFKIKIKSEIVTFGVPEADPNKNAGVYVAPEDWNALISDPDVIVVDTRNDYEFALGTFARAENPHTRSFRQFPAYVDASLDPARHRKVAMFCTGGIRCEKATAFMRQRGFDEVYHLDGGILNYLERVPQDQSLWQGECFVFDERVSVDHKLQPGSYSLCRSCGSPVPTAPTITDAVEPVCPVCQNNPNTPSHNSWHNKL